MNREDYIMIGGNNVENVVSVLINYIIFVDLLYLNIVFVFLLYLILLEI